MTEVEQVNFILSESGNNIEALYRLQKLRIKQLESKLFNCRLGWFMMILSMVITAIILKNF